MQKEDIDKELKRLAVWLGVWGIFAVIWTTMVAYDFNLNFQNTDYIVKGGEGEAFWGAVISSIVYVVGFLPILEVLRRRRRFLKEVEQSSQLEAKTAFSGIEKFQQTSEVIRQEQPTNTLSENQEPLQEENSAKTEATIEEQLKELKSLFDKKLISKAVYDQKQKDIIDKM